MKTLKIKYNKYPKYKDSGVEWLGEIPAEWEAIKIKYIFKERNERSKDGNEDLLSVSQYTGVTKKIDKITEGELLTNAETLEGYKKVLKGDLVSNIMLAWNGSLGFSPYNGITSPAYSIYTLNSNNNNRYFHYLLRTEFYKAEYKRNSSGVIESRLRLYTDDFFQIYSILPPLPEQIAIANFLDDKTAKIDKAISQKQKLIELLKERKQIIIQDLVTGKKVWNTAKNAWTEPDKVKESGVEWIGKIPEHWEVKRLKRITRIKRGASPRPIDDQKYFNNDGEFSWVRIADVSANNHYLTRTVQKLSKLGSSLSVKLYPGELFLSIAGTVGKPMITKIKCCIHDGFVYFPDLKKDFEYLYRILETGRPYIGLGKFGTQLNLNTETVGNIFVPVPPEKEQQQIVNYIENETEKIDKAITLQQKQIEKLKEYKTVLIDSAVTGKIKVS